MTNPTTTIHDLPILLALTCAYAAGVCDGRGKPWPPMDQASRDVAEAARAEYARYVAANAAALRAEGR